MSGEKRDGSPYAGVGILLLLASAGVGIANLFVRSGDVGAAGWVLFMTGLVILISGTLISGGAFDE